MYGSSKKRKALNNGFTFKKKKFICSYNKYLQTNRNFFVSLDLTYNKFTFKEIFVKKIRIKVFLLELTSLNVIFFISQCLL